MNDKRMGLFKNHLHRIIYWFGLATAMVLLFLALLYLSGSGGKIVQQRVKENAQNSLSQFKEEGSYPRIIDSSDESYRLDNFTDSVILQESFFMDSWNDPSSIVANPYYSWDYDGKKIEYTAKIQSLIDAVNTGITNISYSRYWIGIRCIVRPLLIFFTYQEIRGIMSTIFFVLLFLALKQMAHYYCDLIAGALLTTLLMINLPVVSISLQFLSIFIVLFASIIALPPVMKRYGRKYLTTYFFIIGGATQFFDFYTIPYTTLVVPAVLVLFFDEERADQVKTVWKCLEGWAFGYIAMWIGKLAVASIAMGSNQFTTAFSGFFKWTGATANDTYDQFTISYVFTLVNQLLFSKDAPNSSARPDHGVIAPIFQSKAQKAGLK